MISTAKTGPIEYAVYTFDIKKPDQKADMFWRRHVILNSPEEALSEAHVLSQSHKYQKVEVKKKFFDPKQNRMVNVTMKVFQNPDSRTKPWVLGIAVSAAMMGLIAIAGYISSGI